MIRFAEVSKRYPNASGPALEPTSLAVEPRELLVLLGESGSGKTTLLKMVNRLVEPTSGVVEVLGADVRTQEPCGLRRKIGYVIQHVGLFPHFSVVENVGVARALAARPQILLMDEPFGALDPITRGALQIELRRLHESLELTTLLVTHDLLEALSLADRIAVMKDGRLRQIGSPHDLLAAPADDYVAALMGSAREQAERIVGLSRE